MKHRYAKLKWVQIEDGEDEASIVTHHEEEVEILHWGLTIIPGETLNNTSSVPLNRTVAICRIIRTGEVVESLPEAIKFKPENTHEETRL
jgi:hypothetical protein